MKLYHIYPSIGLSCLVQYDRSIAINALLWNAQAQHIFPFTQGSHHRNACILCLIFSFFICGFYGQTPQHSSACTGLCRMHGASLEVKTNLASQCVEYEWNTYNFYFSFLNFFQCDCHLAKVLTLRENLWEEPSFVCLFNCNFLTSPTDQGLSGTSLRNIYDLIFSSCLSLCMKCLCI